jgi:glycosyltransferase involved in cell wall biosynthesis
MKILHLSPYFYPASSYGGPVGLLYQLLTEQAKQHQITVFTSDTFDEQRRISKNEKLKSSEKFSVVYSRNIINGWAFKYRLFTHFSIIIRYWQSRHQFDLLHIHDVFVLPQLIIGLLAIKDGKPVVFSPHGVLHQVRVQKKSLLKQIWMKLFVERLIKKSNTLIATSDDEAKSLSKFIPLQIMTVPNGIKLPSTFKKIKNTKPITTLLYVGRIHQQKGLQELVEAVKNTVSPIKVIIAGPDDGYLTQLESSIEKQNLNRKIEYIGPISEIQRNQLLSEVDIFIYPSYAEGFSISILEALAARLPVIITTGCNFPEVADRKAGVVVGLKNLSSDLATAIDQIATDEKLRKTMSKNAYQLVSESYTIEAMAKSLSKIYEQYK